MSDTSEDDDLRSLLKAALPASARQTSFEVDALRERARPVRKRRLLTPIHLSYALLVLSVLALASGSAARNYFADLAHKEDLKIRVE